MAQAISFQDLHARVESLGDSLDRLNPQNPRFALISRSMRQTAHQLRESALGLGTEINRIMLYSRVEAIEIELQNKTRAHDEGCDPEQIPQEIAAFEAALAPLLAIPPAQLQRAHVQSAKTLYGKIYNFLSLNQFSPDQFRRLKEMERRVASLIPLSPEVVQARAARADLITLRNDLQNLLLLKKDAKQLYLRFMQRHKRHGEALAYELWKKAGKPKVDDFGSKVLRGDEISKMPTKDILEVLTDQIEKLSLRNEPACQALQELRQAIVDQQALLKARNIGLNMLVSFVRDEIGAAELRNYQTKDVIRGDIFTDPRVLSSALNRLVDDIDRQSGLCQFDKIRFAPGILGLISSFLVHPDKPYGDVQSLKNFRLADRFSASGILTQTILRPIVGLIDAQIRHCRGFEQPIRPLDRETFMLQLYRWYPDRSFGQALIDLRDGTYSHRVPHGEDVRPAFIDRRGVYHIGPHGAYVMMLLQSPGHTRIELARIRLLDGALTLMYDPTKLQLPEHLLGQLTNITALNLFCHGLDELPRSLGNLHQLRTLMITGLPNRYIHGRVVRLPNEFRTLINLQQVKLTPSGTHRPIISTPAQFHASIER